MENGFWIWRNNLPGILTVISDMDNFDFSQTEMDEIKHGLIGTSDKKGNWFEYNFNKLKIKLSFDQADNDIIQIQIFGDIDDRTIKLLSNIGTEFELRNKNKRIE